MATSIHLHQPKLHNFKSFQLILFNSTNYSPNGKENTVTKMKREREREREREVGGRGAYAVHSCITKNFDLGKCMENFAENTVLLSKGRHEFTV